MSRIEDAVVGMRYEKDPYYAYRYDQETVDDIEAMLGRPLPEELRWYLLNIGRWELEYDNSSLLVRRGEALLNLRFKGIEDQVFSRSRYEDFLERNEGGQLPAEARHFYPLGQISGEFNPSVYLRLLVNLNEGEEYGSIWAVRPIGHYDDQTPSEPIRLADNLAGFLEQIGPERTLRNQAEKNNEALFKRLFAAELAGPMVVPTSASTAEAVLRLFFDQSDETVFDGVRHVEFDHYVRGDRFETAADIEQRVRSAANLSKNGVGGATTVVRRDPRFGEPEPYDADFVGQKLSKGFMTITITSVVGEGMIFDEQYLLYHDAKAGRWTIVRQLDGKIKDVRVKGVGTFGFDTTYKWHLKKKVAPAWVEFKVALNVDGELDALTSKVIAFIKEIVGKEGFRSVFEDHVFRLYKERYYPEFEAMDEDEKKDWVKHFPHLTTASEIWTLFGKKASLHVHGESAFTLYVDVGFEPEHGLELRVENWRIKKAGGTSTHSGAEV